MYTRHAARNCIERMMKMFYTPRHSARVFRKLERRMIRRERTLATLRDAVLGALGGVVFGTLVGLMFII